MTLTFYFDDDVGARPVVVQLLARHIDTVRSTDVGMRGKPDAEHLAYAAEHGRTLITANRRDFLKLHWEWLGRERSHSGIVIMKQRVSTGDQIRALSLMSETVNRELMTSRLEYLSDWLAE